MLNPLTAGHSGLALLTDLYQLTMAAAYHAHNRNETSTFELYFRRLPRNRSYLLAAGLEQALAYICTLRFTQSDIHFLRSLEPFAGVADSFFEYLAEFKFTGDVWAVPEGTPLFPAEPALQVHAPLIEAQILETYLLSVLNMQTMIATKGARIAHAAAGRGVIDFGTRRAHGPHAAVYAARASYIGGCTGTSNVYAARELDIPAYGTAAHSFTMAFPTELEAFRAYYDVFPNHTVLLIDTYDTLEGANLVTQVGSGVRGVRIDSGDLLDLSKKVRQILDQNGNKDVKILLSGDLNEYKIQDLVSRGAPVDLFGVGTELVTSYDDPALSGVYKLVQTSLNSISRPVMKTSPGKISYPARKQIFRYESGGKFDHDCICLFDETGPGGSPLLQSYIQNGVLIRELPPLKETRSFALEALARLPDAFHSPHNAAQARVELSAELLKMTRELEAQL